MPIILIPSSKSFPFSYPSSINFNTNIKQWFIWTSCLTKRVHRLVTSVPNEILFIFVPIYFSSKLRIFWLNRQQPSKVIAELEKVWTKIWWIFQRIVSSIVANVDSLESCISRYYFAYREIFPRSKAILNFAARSWKQFLLPKYSRKRFQKFGVSMFIIVSFWSFGVFASNEFRRTLENIYPAW